MLEIDGVNIHLPGFSLEDISFSVGPQDIFAILGPTGSGKSVLLEAVMGLMRMSSGSVRLSGGELSGLPPESRQMGLVYQDHALFPHMSVRQNILYGVKYYGIPEATSRSRFDMLVQRLGLGEILHRGPTNLSGGEKQRVALARCLMLDPKALLLDEPLSALDQVFRDDIRHLLKTLHSELAIPFVLVSHSFSEVQLLANKGAVIKDGRLQQTGTVEDLFERPESCFVASFVGMKNVFPCRVSGDRAEVEGITLRTSGISDPGHTHLALRPEEIDVVTDGHAAPENVLEGSIAELDCEGFYFRVGIRVGEVIFRAFWTRRTVKDNSLSRERPIRIGIPARAVHTFADRDGQPA